MVEERSEKSGAHIGLEHDHEHEYHHEHRAKTQQSLQDVSIGDLMGEADADDAMSNAGREESERVVAQQ